MKYGWDGRSLEVSTFRSGDTVRWYRANKLAYVAIGLLLAHLILNREWLTKIAASGQSYRLAAGILVGLMIPAGFLLFPTEHREPSPEHTTRQSRANLVQLGPAKPDY